MKNKIYLILIYILIFIFSFSGCDKNNKQLNKQDNISSECTNEMTQSQFTEISSTYNTIEIANYYYDLSCESLNIKVDELAQLIDNEDLAKLNKFKNLISLSINLDSTQYEYLLNLSNLKNLDLTWTTIDSNWDNIFCKLKNLESLSFSLGNFENDNLEFLKDCNSLKKLMIYQSQTLDISQISNLDNLEYISISVNNIIDYSPLYNLNNIKELSIPDSITENELETLKSKLPNCEINVIACP